MRFTGFWLQRTPHWILKSFESRWILTFKSPWILTVENAMGWLRLVGSLKLQVSYAEYSLFNRALLQKRRRIWSSLLIVATAYSICHVQWLWGLHSVFQAFWPGISRHYQGAQEELFAIQIDSQCSTHCSIYLLIRLQADLRESYNYVCIIYIYTYISIYVYLYIHMYKILAKTGDFSGLLGRPSRAFCKSKKFSKDSSLLYLPYHTTTCWLSRILTVDFSRLRGPVRVFCKSNKSSKDSS